jgi:2-alkyl-3-oxoalkanoate reductase
MRKATGFPLPNGGNGSFSPVYIDNFVDGMVLAVSSGDAVGQVFNISDGQGVRCGDFFGQLATMSGGKLRTIPMSVAAPAAEVLGSVLRRLGQKTDLSAGAIQSLRGIMVASDRYASADARHRDHRRRAALGGGSSACGSGAGWAAAVDRRGG